MKKLGDNALRKFFSFLAILLIATFPVLGQSGEASSVIGIHIETTFGTSLQPDITQVNFIDLPVPFQDEWVSTPEIITWQLSWRGDFSSKQKLVCALTAGEFDCANNLKQIWTSSVGALNQELPGPPADGSQMEVALIGSSSGTGTAELQFQYLNTIDGAANMWDFEITYTFLNNV